MAHTHTQRLREDGRMSSSSSIDSLATNSSESEAGLLGNLTSSISDHHSRHEHTPETRSTKPFSNSQILENAKLGVETSRVNGKGHDEHRRASIPVHLEKVKNGGRGSYLLRMDDDLRKLLSQSRSAAGADGKKRRAKFTDLVFTKRFTTFDRQNPEASGSPFHGFYILFWMSIGMLMVKDAATSYRNEGRIFGIDILSIMFMPNKLIDCLLTDAIAFYGTSLWCVPLQKAINKGYIKWDRAGWILQILWQGFFMWAIIQYTLYKEWSWIQTVYIVLHAHVMLMKQHSYAFYNGHLSGVFNRRNLLRGKLQELHCLHSSVLDKNPAQRHHHRSESGTSTDSGVGLGNVSYNGINQVLNAETEEMDSEQLEDFEKTLAGEIEGCDVELTSRVSGGKPVQYPNNLTWWNYLEYLHFPTVVYELEYPRQDSINWHYVAEKVFAIFGVLGIMILVSQHYMWPVVMKANAMSSWPIEERLKEIPWMFADLLFPFLVEYLMTWYLIWELILNILGELTLFSDRGFYGDWWNSTGWDVFARDWNKPVHNFLRRHVYHTSISSLHVSKKVAALITFLISAIFHELVMWAVFKKVRGYLMFSSMLQIPLSAFAHTKLMRDRKTLGNTLFWIGLYIGPSLICTMYLMV
ncbi:uncharacterized protein H6S33_005723 [Morchella sextelata]|uniref:uncharacterized protein n=1 Tax=Morchella sextelata TaxID=1174677 RepID=UPI001D041D19|nr:uncharacterized protein H6S33_005723 [Morchella sextelata]KAH0613837.1 hypothetical protein H6S33_005723 [Morchella sextelata]